jgi:hypothetical protein
MTGTSPDHWVRWHADEVSKFIMENGGNVTPETRQRVIEASNRLSDTLGSLLRAYGLLQELSWDGDLSQILEYVPKTFDIAENGRRMEAVIAEQPFNPIIQRKVLSVAERGRELADSPRPIGGSLPPVGEFYASEGYSDGNLLWGMETLKLDECLLIAGSLYHFVKGMAGVSDPPSADWFKKPIQTLYVGGGDCDCLTILLSAMAWYVGFPVILNFQEEHVFPSLVLKRLVLLPREDVDEGRIRSMGANYERQIEEISQDSTLTDDVKTQLIQKIKDELMSLSESHWLFQVRDVEVCFDPTMRDACPIPLDTPVPWLARTENFFPRAKVATAGIELPFTAIFTAGFQRMLVSLPESRRLELREQSASLEHRLEEMLKENVVHRHVIKRRVN